MGRINKIITLLIHMLFSNTLLAEIIEIHRITEIEKAITPLKSSELLIFDIDYTLTEPSEPVLQMAVIKQNKERFRKELAKFTDEQKLLVPVLMVTQSESRLTDPSIPRLIQKLQNQKIPLLGFTAIDTSDIPQIGFIPDWRAGELKRLGIDFHSTTASFPKENIEFTEIPAFRGTFPLYKDGILYSNVAPSKGHVLKAFLSKTNQTPSRIIFVDDSLENLQSVEAELKNAGVPYLGIHYREQVDPTKIPKVTENEWKLVWDRIRERAKFITSKERLNRFVAKYGEDNLNRNPRFISEVLDPLDTMIQITPQTIVAKNVSFLKRVRLLHRSKGAFSVMAR